VRRQAKNDVGLHRVNTMLGRYRALPGYAKSNGREVSQASRAAINTPIQGSAADVVAAAMVRINDDPKLKELGWRMLLQVHDEVCFCAPQLQSDVCWVMPAWFLCPHLHAFGAGLHRLCHGLPADQAV
jgi:DNA polymerase I